MTSLPDLSLAASSVTLPNLPVPDRDFVRFFNELVSLAVTTYRFGEDVTFGTTLTMVPQPGGQIAPVLFAAFSMPGAEIGSRTVGTFMSMDMTPSQAQVDDQVRQVIEAMVKSRTDALTLR